RRSGHHRAGGVRLVTARPDVLICAGLDPSGGAGLIADVRVVSELGGRPVGVVTALTVQNTTGVVEVEPVNASHVREQLELLLSDVEVRAVKIGMLGASQVATSIGQALALTGAPVVWDPVIQPSRGQVSLLAGSLDEALAALLPHVAVLTPNAPELALLTGAPVASIADAVAAGQALARRLGVAVLVKGGHLGPAAADPSAGARLAVGANVSGGARSAMGAGASAGSRVEPGAVPAGSTVAASGVPAASAVDESADESVDESVDVLCRPDGFELLRGARTAGGEHVHGTGCALSSALATYLAHGMPLVDACREAKRRVAAWIAAPARPGRGAAAIL
ncbi:MAG TPA: bifunctional hydroxymethylpyrimidine kinase/phosphomethylpyrimidine kinase, partial [Kofleriaceae bacterium]|nr:bifunctional hydroxymethylpyrimidine kinase/phosphomethylpyrimidine kinase [Kofleriaceae bacterium]